MAMNLKEGGEYYRGGFREKKKKGNFLKNKKIKVKNYDFMYVDTFLKCYLTGSMALIS